MIGGEEGRFAVRIEAEDATGPGLASARRGLAALDRQGQRSESGRGAAAALTGVGKAAADARASIGQLLHALDGLDRRSPAQGDRHPLARGLAAARTHARELTSETGEFVRKVTEGARRLSELIPPLAGLTAATSL